ncbi:Uncharacterised protein [Vibrio cholerae]|nr:Uncharacterised protein [Vibrio cholerae]
MGANGVTKRPVSSSFESKAVRAIAIPTPASAADIAISVRLK